MKVSDFRMHSKEAPSMFMQPALDGVALSFCSKGTLKGKFISNYIHYVLNCKHISIAYVYQFLRGNHLSHESFP